MDPLSLIILLTAAGVVLLVGELLLPTHGILGLLGLLCLGAGLVVIFTVNRWAGLIVFLAAIVASPFLVTLAMKVWSRTSVGRGIILDPAPATVAPSPVAVGQTGVAISALRPMGECEFGAVRLEVTSDMGMIEAGTKVRVVAIDRGLPTVRAVPA
jgi:membrane-bound ClpP family serine protease